MKLQKRFLLFLGLFNLMLLAGCAPAAPTGSTDVIQTPPAETSAVTSETPAASQELQLTIVELAAYNGQEGNPAYIAVDGVIYDVTDVPQWKGGKHMGYLAGIDATEALKSSPHGAAKLKGIPIVGTITE
jgi:predicted heme/steroid binding protein